MLKLCQLNKKNKEKEPTKSLPDQSLSIIVTAHPTKKRSFLSLYQKRAINFSRFHLSLYFDFRQ